MKLLTIYLYDLKNSGHFEFVHSIMEFAQQCEGIKNHLAKWLTPFEAAVDEEDRLMQISLKNVISEKLVKLDGERDGLVSSIHGATNAMLKSLDGETADAAMEVMNELVSLKVDIQDNYMNQTGQIDTLTAVLLGAQRANVEKLGMLSLVQRLHDVNQQMHDLLTQRDKEQFDRMNDSLAKARLVTDAAYTDLATSFESYTFLYADELAENDEGFTQFGNNVNARIEYFRRYVLKVNGVPDFSVPADGSEPTAPSTPSEPAEPGEQEPSSPSEGENGSEDSENSDGSEEHDYEYVNPDKLDPAENITIEWLTKYKGTPIKKMVVPLDGQITQDDVPDCPTEGYEWNHGVQDINRQISNNGAPGKVISNYPYDPNDMGVRK